MGTVVVIGGGIVGVSVAWCLAQAGMAVTVIERDALASGATAATFGWLTASSAIEPSVTYPAHYRELKVQGIDEHLRLAAEMDDDSWLHVSGHVEWDMAPGGPERIARKIADLRSWGYSAELLPVRELAGLEPDLVGPAGLETFIYYPREGYIDPGALVGLLASRAVTLGATIRTSETVAGLVREGDRVAGVRLSTGEVIPAEMVVACAGTGLPALLADAGVELPMAHSVGLVAVTGPSPARLRAVHHNEGMSIRPDGAGRIVMRHWDFDAMVEAGTPTEPHPPFIGDLLARVVRVLPALAGTRVEGVRIAVRPLLRDNLPAVGTPPGVEGVYALAGHGAITHGPLLARLAAREVAFGDAQEMLDPYRIARFAEKLAEVR
jgi:glycine/D-amino acid oxidase-like deaminating enzyme